MTLGERLKEWRVSRNMTLRQLARRVGVSHQYLSQIEKGKRGISALTRGVMIQKFGPLDFLLANDDGKD